FLRGALEPLGHLVEGCLPRERLEGGTADPLRADAAQGRGQPSRMVDALGVARHLGADDPRRVAVLLGTMDAAVGAPVEPLHLERAGGRAIVRAGGGE